MTGVMHVGYEGEPALLPDAGEVFFRLKRCPCCAAPMVLAAETNGSDGSPPTETWQCRRSKNHRYMETV